MAIYHLNIKPISRSAGRSAPAAAAYRAGERIRDERTGALHNYSRRQDVSHTEILLPAQLAGTELAWAKDRAALWNAAERAERQRNSRVAREYEVALPAELNPAQRLELARSFARELADRHRVAIDLAIHEPRAAGDPRNHHAHLLATTREVTAAGLAAKAGLDMNGSERRRRGLPAGIDEIKTIRERWGTLTNEALQAAGLEARVDHRTLRARGIDQEPMPKIPFAALQIERRGVRSEVAERIRAEYRTRVQARVERAAAMQFVARSEDAAGQPGAQSLEQLRRQAREAWLTMRHEAAKRPAAVALEHAAPEQGALQHNVQDKDIDL